MKGTKKNPNKKVSSKENSLTKSRRETRIVKLRSIEIMAAKYHKTVRNSNNYNQVNTDSSNITKSPISLCKQVFVVIEELPQEILEKYITNNKNQSTHEIITTENIQLEKLEQSSISEKLPSKEIQSNDNVSYIFDKNSDVDKTSLNLTDNINVNDKSSKKRKNDDRREAEMENEENICQWKVKRRCTLPIEAINTKNRRRSRTSSIESIEEVTVLNNLKPTDNKITMSNSNLHAWNRNITDAKVILIKLEDMDDNIYFINWKKKRAQQALLSENLEPTTVHEDVSINTLPIEIVDNSYKYVTEDSGKHIDEASELNLSTLQSKYKKDIFPKVFLVKLENLRAFYKEQNSFPTIKCSTDQYIDQFKLNLNHSSNVFDCNNEVNSESSNIQSEENSSCTSVVSSISTSEISSTYASETSSTCSESIEDLENQEIQKPLICEIEEKPTLSETSQEESVSIERSIFTSILQKCIERDPEISIKEDKMSKRNSVLKKIQTLPTFITKQNISSNTNNVTLNCKNEMNCEDIRIPRNKKVTIIDNIVFKSRNNVTKKANSIIKLPENVHKEQQKMNIRALNIAASDNVKDCKYSSCKSLVNSENIMEISKSNNTPESSLQQKSYAFDNSSTKSLTSSNTSSLSTISKAKKKKHYHENRDEDELSHCEIFEDDNSNILRCNICSKLFDSVVSLSNHVYSHTKEKQLETIYKQKKQNQNSKYINASSNDDKITDIIDSDEEIQKSVNNLNEEPVDRPVVTSTIVESLQSSLQNAKDESMINKITSMKEMKLQKNILEGNVSETLTIEPNKDESIKNSTVHEKISLKFCACHEKRLEKLTSMDLILFCNICNVLYHTVKCFKAHLNEKYLCNGKKLTKRTPRLYCNICKILLSDPKKMRKHMENHLMDLKSIKLFCHICKIRFIGMGPIFLKHWLNHDADCFYEASVSHFPAISIVNTDRKEWSIINSDEFKYFIITEHVCNSCNVQCFSTNQLKEHMLSCKNKSAPKLPSMMLPKDHRNSDVQSKVDVPAKIDKISAPSKSSSEEHNFACEVCSDTFESLKKLMIHFKTHYETPVDFTCNRCKQSFGNFIKYVEHLQDCLNTVDSGNDTLCQYTNRKKEFICKICNITFDSKRALYRHNMNYKNKFPHSIETVNRSTEQIKQNNRVAAINESISEVPENQNSIVNWLIDSPQNFSSVKSNEIVSGDVSLSNQSITNQDSENLSSNINLTTDDLNTAKINNFMGNSRSSVKNKINKDENACKVNNDSNKNGSKKDLNNRNTTVIVKSSNSKQKTVLDINTPPSKTININKNDEITLIEPEIPRKNQEHSKENNDKITLIEPEIPQKNQEHSKENNDEITLIEPEIPRKNQENSKENNDKVTLIEPEISRKNQENSKENNNEITLIEPEIQRKNQENSKENNEVTLIEPEIPRKNSNENSCKAVEPTTNLQLNNSTETSKESVKGKKYLRVRNILEMVERPLKYKKMFIEKDESTSTSMSSSMNRNSSNQIRTKRKKSHHLSSAIALTLPSTTPTFPSTVSTLASMSGTKNTSVLQSPSISVSVQETVDIPITETPKLSQVEQLMLPKRAIPIEQEPLSMPIGPYKISCSTRPEISIIKNPNIRPYENVYSVNHTSAATNNFNAYIEQQSQNIIYALNALNNPRRSSTNPITNNYENTTTIIQENNNEFGNAASLFTLSPSTTSASTASTSTASTSTVFSSTAYTCIPSISTTSASTASVSKASTSRASTSRASVSKASTSTPFSSIAYICISSISTTSASTTSASTASVSTVSISPAYICIPTISKLSTSTISTSTVSVSTVSVPTASTSTAFSSPRFSSSAYICISSIPTTSASTASVSTVSTTPAYICMPTISKLSTSTTSASTASVSTASSSTGYICVQSISKSLTSTTSASTASSSTASTSTAFSSSADICLPSISKLTTSTPSTSTICTSTAINSQLIHYFSNNNFRPKQQQNTENLIRTQNTFRNNLCNNLSNIVAKANFTDIRPQNRMELRINNNTSNLPVSFNQYSSYDTNGAPILYNSLTKMQSNNSNNNNNLLNGVTGMQQQSNNNRRKATNFVIPAFERRLHRELPNLELMFPCKYCPNDFTLFSRIEYNVHINSKHFFMCNICNNRFYTVAGLEDHKLNYHNVGV